MQKMRYIGNTFEVESLPREVITDEDYGVREYGIIFPFYEAFFDKLLAAIPSFKASETNYL